MRFSNKAYKYLDKLSKNKDFVVSDRQLIVNYLKSQNIQPFDKIIEFQTDFSGLSLTVTYKPNSTFKASLFPKKDIKQDAPIDIIEIDGQLYFYCGAHSTAQCWFVISGSGQICTYNNNDETVNIIFSSFDKFIETYAYEDWLAQNPKYEHPYYYNLIDSSSFEVLTQHFAQHDTANDDYNKWLSNDNLIIYKGTWYDKPGFYIHVYDEDSKHCETFIQHLKDQLIIS
ncbi:MAG: hypothetical protein ACTHMM_13825 [Agriterribacter sp.]